MNETKEKTPTEVMISALEQFGEDEPETLLILSLTKGGDLCWNSNTNRTAIKLGMVELYKQILVKGM